MLTTVQLKDGTILQLENKAFACGGEGELYRIKNSDKFYNQVVKIYKPEKRTKEREKKIEYLANNPPALDVIDGHHSVIWINQLVFDNGEFCGFIMPIAKGEKLELLCHSKLPKILNVEWNKFDFKNPKSIELRLKLCFNIAVAIYHIHKLSGYVLIDLKPENIMVQLNGLISLIDIDSVAIVKNNKVIFPAPVATPEYTPPEYYKGIKLDGNEINETWDRFSMSIIFYRLLCGIHPFTGSCIAPYNECNGLVDMVQNGLFPNGVKRTLFKVIPPPHSKFNNLKTSVQELFILCYNEGHSNPNNRPNADEWCRILSTEEIFQINRTLPSSVVPFPVCEYSAPIFYNPTIKLPLLNINYINPKPQIRLKELISKFFGKSKQQQLIDLINQKEKELNQKEQKYKLYITNFESIIILFKESQKVILIQEKSKIKKLKDYFLLELSNFDKKAKELNVKEIKEIKEALDLLKNSLIEIEHKNKLCYSNILGKKYETYECQKSTLQTSLKELQLQEQIDITNLINNPNKLSKYPIQNAIIKNFGYNTYASLKSVGIFTAADFIDISANGYLKNRQGKWVKANGIGWSRAYDLREWKRALELKENQEITQIVKQNYKYRLSLLNDNISNLDLNFQKEIYPLTLQYNKEKAVFEEAKLKLKQTHKEKRDKIEIYYNDLNLAIINNAKIYLNIVLPQIKNIMEETVKELNSNLDNYKSKFELKKLEIGNYKLEIDIEIKILENLQKELNLL